MQNYRPISYFLILFAIILSCLEGSDAQDALNAPYIYNSVNVITGSYVESCTDLTLAGPHPLVLKRCYQSQIASNRASSSGWFTNLRALFIQSNEEEPLPPNSGTEYEHDSAGRLVEVRSVDAKKGVLHRWMKFTYQEEDGACVCSVEADDQTRLRYRYMVDASSHNGHSLYLLSVEKGGAPLVSYEYQKHPQTRSYLISRRDEPNGRYLIADYYDQSVNDVGGVQVTIDPADFRWGRVKTLRAPAGEDASPVVTHRFFYGDGYTEVRDALDHKVVYRYSGLQRLTAIEYYDESDALYRAERFCWRAESSLPQPLMVSRVLEDGAGRVVYGRTFDYDRAGNLIKSMLTGDLTGSGRDDESFTIQYHYGEESRLTYKQEGDHLKVNYAYDADKRLVSEHQFIDDTFHIRTFYEYDEDGSLVATITDDGSGKQRDDLKGARQRRLTKIVPSTAPASYGEPVSVEELYWDFEAAHEKTLSKTLNTYSERGQLIRQQTYDAAGVCFKDISYVYDADGHPSLECENGGDVKALEFDLNGNITLQTTQKADGSLSYKRMRYDFSNRLISCEEGASNEEPLAASHRYNVAGLKIADVVDGRGTTVYSYDAMGRLVEVRQPPVADWGGSAAASVITYQYNVCDNVSLSTDANGWTTRARYNAHGKPVEIEYPDGTTESFKYNLAGVLVREKSRTGLITAYERDGLGRAIKSTVADKSGQQLSCQTCTYSSFNVLTQADACGSINLYGYDGGGRLVELVERTSDGDRRTTYLYDERGRICEKRTMLADGYLADVVVLGDDGQPAAVNTIDQRGAVLHNIAGEGPASSVVYRHCGLEVNASGQEVRYSVEADERGGITKTVYDVLGRVFSVSRRDSMHAPGDSVEYRYDAAGNKTGEVHYNADLAPVYVLEWKYGVGNRLEVHIEGVGSQRQRVTEYVYNDIGQVKRMIKPDGIFLRYKYNHSGTIDEVVSSDGTIDYVYQYDAKGNITAIHERLTGCATTRRYTAFNELSAEKLATGPSFEYRYNPLGQRVETLLPDGTAATYVYKGKLLKAVRRLDREGRVIYAHTYGKYVNGKAGKATLIGGLGTLCNTYDDAGRLSAMRSPYWSECIDYGSSGSIIQRKIEDAGGFHTCSYSYNGSDELVAEDGFDAASYEYDTLGNSKSVEIDGLNQLIAADGVQYLYDANGNLAMKADGHSVKYFTYDPLNRLISVLEPKKSRTDYVYDGFNRRLSKSIFTWSRTKRTWTSQHTENYLYDGMCEIGAADASGCITQLRILGSGKGAEIGAAIAVELAGETYAPIHDSRGNIVSLVSLETKEAVECYRYSAFGKSRTYDGDGRELAASSAGMPWGFSGKRLDAETGWIYFGVRHYDPSTRRWTTPDPLGHLDGPNRYAYVHNNPVMNRDCFGEFTIGEVWHSCAKLFSQGFDLLSNIVQSYQHKVGYASYSRHEVEEYTNAIVGSFFLRMTGFYIHQPEVGVLGRGEINDKVRVTMINGILNIRAEYVQTVAMFSKAHGGVNIHYVFRPSDGWAHDLLKCVLAKSGVFSPQSRLLARTWKRLIHEMGGVDGGGLVIHYAHSIGGTESNNAKRLLTLAERKMIKVITFGSATLIPEGDFQSVVNYASWRDGVCYFDPIGCIRAMLNRDCNIFFIESSYPIPTFDHLLENESYASVINMLGAEFVRTYGSF